MPQRRALITRGGWDGHQPIQTTDRFAAYLRGQDFEVIVQEGPAAYADAAFMAGIDLVVQNITMSSITDEQSKGIQAAVRNGTGLAGWHGGLCDAFRGNIDWQWMTGGQFLGHPGGIIDFEVQPVAWDDPVMAGIGPFRMRSEQYYMLVEPSNLVLATTTFDGVHDAQRKGVVMPVAWKRLWGQGRVFFSALGHVDSDFEVSQARTIMERGLLWAARR
jgi:hypothetical protein